jgi:serine/threonine protein phosphatase PrpC
MEDRHSTHTLNEHGVLLGMFDGHSGFEASDAASIFLASYVSRALAPLAVTAAEADVAEALKQGFLDFDNDLTGAVPDMALAVSSCSLNVYATAQACACLGRPTTQSSWRGLFSQPLLVHAAVLLW